ncbi:MAG: hypothetical protein ACTSU5_07810 [Promethearchaeota archaeon]
MPIGLVVMRWDERMGAEICATYPEDTSITEKTLMQVYSTHEYSGEAGMVSLMVGSLNIASYYTGPETSYYFLLLLSLEEDPDVYEDGMADLARIFLANLEGKAYEALIPSLFQRISVYPSLRDEQKLAMIYVDEAKRMILTRLRDEGNVSKSELSVWLKDEYKQGFVDIDTTLTSLVKEDLVKESSVKGITSEVIFLVNDVAILRVPPLVLLREASQRGLPPQLVEEFRTEVKTFFQTYQPSEEDNLKVLNVFLDPQVYEALTLMRVAVVTRDDLEKLKKKGVEDVDFVLKTLWDANILTVLRDDQGNEYYALKTDIVVERYFPEHMIDVVRKCFRERTKTNASLVEHLNILEDYYYSLKERKAEQSKKGAKASA